MSRIIFKIDAPETFEGALNLQIGTLGEQKIMMSINGTAIYSGVLEAWDKVLDIPFDKILLKDGTNTLAFELPDVRKPENGDQRILALALKSLQIR